ncbi:hypothetical protein RvY_16926 [Ramazzottius varieornatus]|uniref:Uncharacterized protein n=1 Tax=Ramazzottius varieornatus TaxID=947166 RepID=A0A1D1W4G0_RAMVA|nr:hypothetical protein RvY_16926 [Ramazzottius varieornatus]
MEKDGNHFVVASLHWILSNVLDRYGGKIRTSAIADGVTNVMYDVRDGDRWKNMRLIGTDLVISVHADSAAISKSTQRKMYLIFIHLLNLPIGLRRNMWPLFLVWVGEALPKDREAFLMELSLQLNALQKGSAGFQPVSWKDMEGRMKESSTYLHSVWSDTPERAAINGQFSHAAAQECIYCTQTAECIDHVMCYKYKKNPVLKSHDEVVTLSTKWHTLTLSEQKKIHEDRSVGGFKRPSLVHHWRNFNMVEGFAQDVMHQMDEGLSKFFLKAIVEGTDAMKLTKNQINEIDRRWLSITVPGHDNRKLRSIRTYKQWKAHELRFFLQHGDPFVTRGIVPKAFHNILRLASSIAWSCTQDSVTRDDVTKIERLSSDFLQNFEKYFGVGLMKYSVHVVQHIPMALNLFGPLHLVSCYGPESEIGKISRRICGTNKTTKQIMNSFLTLTECSSYLNDAIAPDSNKDKLVIRTALHVLNLPMPVFSAKVLEGVCRLLGRPQLLRNENELKLLRRYPDLQDASLQSFYSFKRARVENGIYIRTCAHSEKSVRNEIIIIDQDHDTWKVLDIIAFVRAEDLRVERTFVYGEKMKKVDENRIEVDHIYSVQASDRNRMFLTSSVRKQLVILRDFDYGRRIVISPPSNIYFVT